MSAVKALAAFFILIALVMNSTVWALPIIERHEVEDSALLVDHDKLHGGATTEDCCHHFCHGVAHSLALIPATANLRPAAREQCPVTAAWSVQTVTRAPLLLPPILP